MAQRLETFRREVARWVEECVFKPVAEWNGFTIEGERGQEEIIYPTIKFDDLQLRDDTGKLQMMVKMGLVRNYCIYFRKWKSKILFLLFVFGIVEYRSAHKF